MARFTQFPLMITRSTIIYDIISPGAAGSSIYVLIRFLNVIRVVQTHTVWFERPFLLRLGTLLPDYTILGKLDFRSRIPKPDFRSRTLIRRRTHSQFVSKYTVLFLEPIRSLLDPSRVSHTIIGTSDSS